MDIIKFHNPTNPTKMEQGEIVNNIKTKMWVERYQPAGEFTFTADANSNVKEDLAIGTLISHINTPEVMIVENHEISEQKGQEPQLKITGRTFETYFENRVVGSNKVLPQLVYDSYNLAPGYTWNQGVKLINDHIDPVVLVDDNDQLRYVTPISQIPSTGPGAQVPRVPKRGSVYAALLEILKVDNVGIRTYRPGYWSPLVAGSPNLAIGLHLGVDRSAQVIFSYDTGEIESADYLWSMKLRKNAALVTGKWVETSVVPAGITEYDRRWMHVDGSDVDQGYSAVPQGADYTTVANNLYQKGVAALAAQNDLAITKADVSKDATKAIYRTDFDVGDLITVSGDYNEVSRMRVDEFVEVEDEHGESSFPSLSKA